MNEVHHHNYECRDRKLHIVFELLNGGVISTLNFIDVLRFS